MRFENVLNWGNIIVLAVMLLSGLTAFNKVQAEVQYLRDVVMESRRGADATELRLRSLELGFGRIEERLIAIQNILQNSGKP